MRRSTRCARWYARGHIGTGIRASEGNSRNTSIAPQIAGSRRFAMVAGGRLFVALVEQLALGFTASFVLPLRLVPLEYLAVGMGLAHVGMGLRERFFGASHLFVGVREQTFEPCLLLAPKVRMVV